jgi:hypothetical protein
MNETGRLDALADFATLHMRTCGGISAMQVHTKGITLRQRCTCGAEMSLEISVDDVNTFRELCKSDRAFATWWTRADRRTVQ